MTTTSLLYNTPYFAEWEAGLRSSVLNALPSPDVLSTSGYLETLRAVDGSHSRFEAAKKELDRIERQQKQEKASAGGDSDGTTAAAVAVALLDGAKSAVEAARLSLQDAEAKCQAAGYQVLDELDRLSFLGSSVNNGGFDDADLILYVTLKTVGAKQWAEWCRRGETETALLLSTLHDPDTLRLFHASGGGPRANNWLAAVEAQSQLNSCGRRGHPVLRRLALAVALELAGEIPVRVVQSDMDPLERYLHYEQAYLDGELDPSFEQFCAWELRMAIDSDAGPAELAWARECLRNYRPDHVLSDDPQWRYCRIVRTDVGYNKPDWYKPKRSYDQILSGGGMCGPRAWYGRFICKAFGIPTWGCRQPGHAAMARWTSQGWQTCLGGGMRVSEWENKNGNFLKAQMQALYALRSEEAYLRHVQRLWLVGNALGGEHSLDLMRRAIPSVKCPWKSLAFLQMKRVAAKNPSNEPLFPRTGCVETLIEKCLTAPTASEQILNDSSRGVVVIPGTCFSRRNRCTIMRCFEGGKQLLLGENNAENAEVEYTLKPAHLVAGAVQYRLTIRVCTVHRNELPLELTVTSNRTTQVYSLPIPYTIGMWQYTEPVTISAQDKGAVLTLVRPSKKYTIAIRCFQLEAIR